MRNVIKTVTPVVLLLALLPLGVVTGASGATAPAKFCGYVTTQDMLHHTKNGTPADWAATWPKTNASYPYTNPKKLAELKATVEAYEVGLGSLTFAPTSHLINLFTDAYYAAQRQLFAVALMKPGASINGQNPGLAALKVKASLAYKQVVSILRTASPIVAAECHLP